MSAVSSLQIFAPEGIASVHIGDDIAEIIGDALAASNTGLCDGDVVCVASKIVSRAGGRRVELSTVQVTETAQEFHSRVPRKDERVLQLIVDQTGDPSGGRVQTRLGFIGGQLPNGLMLTSAGVDQDGSEAVILLPSDPDASAAEIAAGLHAITGKAVAVVITDSDGRPDKRGATQIAVGIHGMAPLRLDQSCEETLCDMAAAAAGLLMGQRGTGRPVAIIRGLHYTTDQTASIRDATIPVEN